MARCSPAQSAVPPNPPRSNRRWRYRLSPESNSSGPPTRFAAASAARAARCRSQSGGRAMWSASTEAATTWGAYARTWTILGGLGRSRRMATNNGESVIESTEPRTMHPIHGSKSAGVGQFSPIWSPFLSAEGRSEGPRYPCYSGAEAADGNLREPRPHSLRSTTTGTHLTHATSGDG